MKITAAVIVAFVVVILAACGSVSGTDAAPEGAQQGVTALDLQHHHWNLVAINGDEVDPAIKSDLEFGEHFTFNGLAGCNRFFGSAKIENQRLIFAPLGTTKMVCPAQESIVETAVLKTLEQGATIKYEPQRIELIGQEYTLTYQLADWM